jgi:hypothetical protein
MWHNQSIKYQVALNLHIVNLIDHLLKKELSGLTSLRMTINSQVYPRKRIERETNPVQFFHFKPPLNLPVFVKC